MLSDEFKSLALAEMGAVYRLASHLARDRDEADDAAQETYLRAFRSAATFRPTEHGMRPWLFKILHNVLSTRVQQAQRERAVVEDARAQAEATAAEPAGPAELADTLNWENIDERLKAAIAALSLPHRTAFLLCAVEGMGYREIAEVMGVPVGTVMSRLFRSRAILSTRLTELAAEHGLGRARRPPIDEMERPA